jgi:hypothetical protein
MRLSFFKVLRAAATAFSFSRSIFATGCHSPRSIDTQKFRMIIPQVYHSFISKVLGERYEFFRIVIRGDTH